MMIESMAGKAAALHGICQDATPFKFSEDFSAADYFGKMLEHGTKIPEYNFELYLCLSHLNVPSLFKADTITTGRSGCTAASMAGKWRRIFSSASFTISDCGTWWPINIRYRLVCTYVTLNFSLPISELFRQVRTTGPVDQITHQPIKGRKKAGGIRLGEMERDSLLAHGASFLLHDRLFNCSDGTQVNILCGHRPRYKCRFAALLEFLESACILN